MRKLQSLGAVYGHQADSILCFAGFQRDHTASLAKESKIVDQFFQFRRPIDFFPFPLIHEVQRGLKNRRARIQFKLPYYDIESSAGLRPFAADLFSGTLYSGENIRAAIDPIESGEKRDHLAFPIVAGNRPHHLAKLLRIHPKPCQRRNPEQADVIAGRHDSVQTGKQVAGFGSIGDVHALDDKRNSGFGQFVDNVVALVAFYTDVLGLSERTDRPDLGIAGAWLDAGGQQVHLLEAPIPPNLGQHLSLQVSDIDDVVAEIRSHGVVVSDPSGIARDRQAFLVDPSGNAIELHERGGNGA